MNMAYAVLKGRKIVSIQYQDVYEAVVLLQLSDYNKKILHKNSTSVFGTIISRVNADKTARNRY